MSSWKDTVMTRKELAELLYDGAYLVIGDNDHRIAEVQAEISFKLRTDDILKQLNEFNRRGLTITEAIDLLQ